MYDKYNVVVRARGGHAMASAEHLVKKFVAICRGNTCVAPRRVSRRISRRISRSYATTIHAINSAIIKLSKLTRAGVVYRGYSGHCEIAPR